MIFVINVFDIDWPEQVIPLPEYPCLQAQDLPPIELVQIPSVAWHPPLLVKHSSISKVNQKRCAFIHVNQASHKLIVLKWRIPIYLDKRHHFQHIQIYMCMFLNQPYWHNLHWSGIPHYLCYIHLYLKLKNSINSNILALI